MKSAPLSEEQIIKKLESFCAYRERCESEVKQKLYQLAVDVKETDFYINYLKENNFLNEDRFIAAFARGKFNIKSWGKRKIIQELQVKRIDSKKILQSIENIDEGQYFVRLQDLLEKKLRTIKEIDVFKKKQKLMQYAMQKGYEMELIIEALKEINL
ncbi:MAG: regulatory protein RecX [Chitinophagales bacterium]|jgi:regulatory protein|nr:regulatory protein RecX [Chitinophagales bacterium]HNY54853.1 regulatory protein RecX [Chitinophagales bacterium]